MEIECPKCSANSSSYIYHNDCNTYWCMTCNIYFYLEDKKVIENFNPHCTCQETSSMSSIDLND
jgi:hypothetical protein